MKSAVLSKEENKQEMKQEKPVLAHPEHRSFLSLQHEVNRFFDELRQGWGFGSPRLFEPLSEYMPKIDVRDTEKAVLISAELPGVKAEDISLNYSSDGLSIKGEKKEEKEESEKGYYRLERNYGSFYRLIPIAIEIDNNKINANFKNGVLTVTLPKVNGGTQAAQKITIKSE